MHLLEEIRYADQSTRDRMVRLAKSIEQIGSSIANLSAECKYKWVGRAPACNGKCPEGSDEITRGNTKEYISKNSHVPAANEICNEFGKDCDGGTMVVLNIVSSKLNGYKVLCTCDHPTCMD